MDQASGISRRWAASGVPATATVPETTTYGSLVHVDGRNVAR